MSRPITTFGKTSAARRKQRRRRLRVESLEDRRLLAVSFQFNYTDTAGSGFNASGDTGQARRGALELAANIFGSSALASYNATINLNVSGTAQPLAAAGSEAAGDPAGGGFGRTQVIRNKILSNGATDLNGSAVDGSVDWDFATTQWELDINTTPSGNEYDFYSTVYHELIHAIGWSHSIEDLSAANTSTSGQDPFGDGTSGADGGTGAAGEWNEYDRFLSDSAGNRIINESTFLVNSTATWNALQVGGASPNNGLFFNGPNAVAANGGNPVGLYTPNPIESGSSISHLDDDNPALANLMMLQATSTGPSARTLSEIELGMLKDLGFTQIRQIVPTSSNVTVDTIGFYQPDLSLFHLKNTFEAGASDQYFAFGPGSNAGWIPLTGDWNGDGVDTIGLYQPDISLFHLKDSFTAGASDQYFAFGPGGSAGWIPLAGDWNGDGTDTIGLYQPDTSLFHLKNSFTAGASDQYFAFGPGGNAGWTPLAGDWNGDGTDTIGLYQPDTSLFHLKDSFTAGASDQYFAFGPGGNAGWTPLVGDWNGDGTDTIGLYQPDASLFHLKDSFTAGASDQYFAFGPGGNAGWTPLSGDWNGPSSSAPPPNSNGPGGLPGGPHFGLPDPGEIIPTEIEPQGVVGAALGSWVAPTGSADGNGMQIRRSVEVVIDEPGPHQQDDSPIGDLPLQLLDQVWNDWV